MEFKEIKSGNDLKRRIKNVLALIDFSAPWCAPCRLQNPIIQQLAAQFEGRVLIAGINVDNNSDLALSLSIQSIPTLIIFKGGREIQRFVGLQSKTSLSEALEKLLE